MLVIGAITRDEITALCTRLGYDPAQVSRIEITGRTVVVTTVHRITDDASPDAVGTIEKEK